MVKVGFVGWRGMVGSVLLSRLVEEKQLPNANMTFFSVSQAGELGPEVAGEAKLLEDANDIQKLSTMDVIITCQGGDYTNKIHPALRKHGWEGYWLDAASPLRADANSILVLGPINQSVIHEGLNAGVKDFVGANCTVSLLLLAIGGLLKQDLVEWVNTQTYQAQSGAGSEAMGLLLSQTQSISQHLMAYDKQGQKSVMDIDQYVTDVMQTPEFKDNAWQTALFANIYPWIDEAMADTGQTREEWKAAVEANKILKSDITIPIDGICVRVPVMRCHAQAVTLKLKKEISINEIETIIANTSDWTRVVSNTKEATLRELTPAVVSGTLTIPVGRIRKLSMGPQYLSLFTLGDQLLWGAAEPLRLAYQSVIDYLS